MKTKEWQMVLITLFIVTILTGCTQLKLSSTHYKTIHSSIYPNWNYTQTRSSTHGTGNCVDYAVAAYEELLRRGIKSEFWFCKVRGQPHMALIVDGKWVYSVGMERTRKDQLDWEWVEKLGR